MKKSYSATYIAFSLKGFFLKPNWAISTSDFDSAYISVLVKSLKKKENSFYNEDNFKNLGKKKWKKNEGVFLFT